jgi:hypothetical protein
MQTGAFGQGIALGKVIFLGLLATTLAGCGAAGDGRYAGHLVTTQGDCGLGFDSQGNATATLTLRGSEAQFAPTDGVTVLPGHVDGAGHVLAGSNATGADKKPFPQVFDGSRAGEHVHGTFATPRCRASVELART